MNKLSDSSRRVVATFTNLVENKKYSASALVQPSGGGGGVINQSPLVDISE